MDLGLGVVMLSRIQFALTIMFHYIFPPLTIGMGLVLVHLEWMYLRTGDALYAAANKFWIKIFILNFAMGVATGIVMEFQFGTNWSAYSRFVGDVFGSALAAEGIFAFFLESGFLAVVAFGRGRVSRKFYFFSVLMVALGSIFSSIWIVVAGSWQHTPAGSHMVQMVRDGTPWFIDGRPVMRVEITSFWQMVFNPSTVHRLVHVWIGAFIMGAFFVMSISAYYILRGRHLEFARRSFRGALVLATVSSLAALVSGHLQAKNVYATQPAKLAAFEGHFQTGRADLSLLGLPDAEAGRVRMNLAIPGGLSFLVHEDFSEPVLGLNAFRPEHRPPVLIPFVSYHVMVSLGMFFIALTLVACFFWWRGTLFEQWWLMAVFVVSVLGAVAANELGWVAAEVGRQPWIVHPQIIRGDDGEPILDGEGYVQYRTQEVTLEDGSTEAMIIGLTTRDGVSTRVSGEQVLGSILGFGAVYGLLFVVWLLVLNDKIQHGPEPVAEPPDHTSARGVLGVAAERPAHTRGMMHEAEPGNVTSDPEPRA